MSGTCIYLAEVFPLKMGLDKGLFPDLQGKSFVCTFRHISQFNNLCNACADTHLPDAQKETKGGVRLVYIADTHELNVFVSCRDY